MSQEAVYLEHILKAIERIERYVSVGHDRFYAEPHWQDAVIRQLELIGEATKRLSRSLRSRYPEVAWSRMSGMRDILIHNYMDVDLDVVWLVTQEAIPELREQIAAILEEERQ